MRYLIRYLTDKILLRQMKFRLFYIEIIGLHLTFLQIQQSNMWNH